MKCISAWNILHSTRDHTSIVDFHVNKQMRKTLPSGKFRKTEDFSQSWSNKIVTWRTVEIFWLECMQSQVQDIQILNIHCSVYDNLMMRFIIGILCLIFGRKLKTFTFSSILGEFFNISLEKSLPRIKNPLLPTDTTTKIFSEQNKTNINADASSTMSYRMKLGKMIYTIMLFLCNFHR